MDFDLDNSTLTPRWPRLRFVSTAGLSIAADHFIEQGETKEIREKRYVRVEAFKPKFPDIVGRLHRGTQPIAPFSGADIDSRVVCVLNDTDQLIVRSIDAQAKAVIREAVHIHPEFQRTAFPPSVHGALWGLIDDTTFIAQKHGQARVLLFDVMRAYKSLVATNAITRFADVTGTVHIPEALSILYNWILLDCRFRGIQEGPSTSPLLFELAILPLDLLLTGLPGVRVRRYVDNYALSYPPTTDGEAVRAKVKEAMAIFNNAEGVSVEAHEWEEGTYILHQGFAPSVSWLGIELVEQERRVTRKKLDDIETKISRKEVQERLDYRLGLAGYYSRLLTATGWEELAEVAGITPVILPKPIVKRVSHLYSRRIGSSGRSVTRSAIATHAAGASSGRLGVRSIKARGRGSIMNISLSPSRVTNPLCRQSRRCIGGIYHPSVKTPQGLHAVAEQIASAFLGRSAATANEDRDRLLVGDRHEILKDLFEDFHRERLDILSPGDHPLLTLRPRVRLVISPNEVLCGGHLRAAVRAYLILDHFVDRGPYRIGDASVADVRTLSRITVAAPWVLSFTSLVLLARRRGWIRGREIPRLVAGVQRLPAKVRWPASMDPPSSGGRHNTRALLACLGLQTSLVRDLTRMHEALAMAFDRAACGKDQELFTALVAIVTRGAPLSQQGLPHQRGGSGKP